MEPFKIKTGGSLEMGVENEYVVTSGLKRFISCLSDKHYSTGRVVEKGLLVNRQVRVCATSPDGIVELYKLVNRTMVFIGLCVLEIKTKGAETTATELDHTIASLGGKFHVCKAGTDDFRKYIKEPYFRITTMSTCCSYSTIICHVGIFST